MPKSKSNNSQERSDIFIAIVVTALFGAFVLNTIFAEYTDNDDTRLSDALTASSLFVSDSSKDAFYNFRNNKAEQKSIDAEFRRKKIQAAPILAPTKTEYIKSNKSTQVPGSASTSQVDKTENQYSEKQILNNTLSSHTDSIIKEDNNQEENEEDEASLSSVSEQPSPQTEPIVAKDRAIEENIVLTVDQDECGIIVGSYGSRKNQLNMIQKLKSDGYDTFGYKEKGLYITALRLPCDPVGLRSTVKVIRQDYAKGAFIITK